jgi:hypothetical protein
MPPFNPLNYLKFRATAILIIFSLIGVSLNAQSDISREYQVKAVFIYNFSHFIEWKSDLFNDPLAPFVIGIFGDDPFGKYLDETVQGEKINGHPIKIYHFKNIKEIHNCQILYINPSDSKLLKDCIFYTNGKKILSVSDSPDFANDGGIIQFIIKENKTRLLINLAAVKASGLNVSSKLLRLAKTIN